MGPTRSPWRWGMPLLLCALGAGCGHVSRLRPAEHGKWEAEAAFGGPVVAGVAPVPIPVPLGTVGARYGVHPRGDLGAHLHLLPPVFDVVGVDVDSAWTVLEQRGFVPHLTGVGRLYGFAGRGAAAAYLEVTPGASWRFGERFTTYLAPSLLVQFAGGQPLFSVGAGEEVRFGRLSLQGEVRWYQPDYATRFTVVDWQSPGGQGGWGLVLGAAYRFGGGQ